ncbi:DNA-formamidopyrimidine glycosylase [Prochlorococcus marinus]|uniref:Formamidopyrimidine-DNA glycosylase n=1 Tax=Prochlorococcus marinus (strain MIT 9211) TaxID=93059 RepID=FPG_PROM4|nr:DNA-formamidopyrimidine glycosylase [Prochlorococcus marinus]A9BDY5.1 RecName: Full=Formamidopyrimidine-DNA glycosylase; Short=Fapy-DNA glycosylase; AltName: Full=DNA-(apurinic or apyrimidinic site) lyase MutM; Short=AP lyase MutM [Prochlorococcus marinus str. MIT 9211]ABX08295.1 Formamidopyrimidine-DNA glycolase (FAPY-DNA glycolase) [Prochlorococcus marinus str. MIT 9211]
MPELPEVETVRKGLEKRLKNFYIDNVEVLSERSIASNGGSNVFIFNLKDLVFGRWSRRGKYLIASLCKESDLIEEIPSGTLVVHLRMTGYFEWHQNTKAPCTHTRVRFWNKKGSEIRFIDIRNFGQMWWIPPNKLPSEVINGLKNLGPEPFSKDFNPEYLKYCLKGRKRSIKSSLLDQSILAGVGNIYADESLFEAGITPIKASGDLNGCELKKLCKSLTRILKASIGKGGTTFSDFRDLEGLNGTYGGYAWVYRRNQKPCRKCGTLIEKTKVAGRSTHWCPNCQN